MERDGTERMSNNGNQMCTLYMYLRLQWNCEKHGARTLTSVALCVVAISATDSVNASD